MRFQDFKIESLLFGIDLSLPRDGLERIRRLRRWLRRYCCFESFRLDFAIASRSIPTTSGLTLHNCHKCFDHTQYLYTSSNRLRMSRVPLSTFASEPHLSIRCVFSYSA
ncbi:hypothetical protein SCLCIDRAFT_31810 [Scleroderma citrinum Foug A]|uniref:Uncharacterized protein n=1 Tax=Scleroderma citrinum Foug A TaxID=1036808 RepID=A0A0C2ZLL8_9AGAM|nr:hypothetical protein SCLCIDRAFT_31810 [Scleroderma citrinum Foug A]